LEGAAFFAGVFPTPTITVSASGTGPLGGRPNRTRWRGGAAVGSGFFID
jgi:hypothetical protein